MAYQREVRIGLVLYGGVSLAIYENGIAQELYRAIRKDGFYRLLSKLIDSDVVVDIISGTSAGGDNGIMLAYALANQKNFLPSADLWRNQGDIERLMRAERDPNPSSILDSGYYQARLTECYASGMTRSDDPPAIGELDLFVTSTDANGSLSTVYDELGHAIDLKNHRGLFQLQYRGERKNDFAAPAADLATLSRMTSCFPVAFQPVEIGAQTAFANFYRWGKLRGPAVYLDGGILNNKPFTSTIDAIASRPATREVDRFLIYVEPSPEQFATQEEPPVSPSMLKAGIDALISIPGYQSISGDLEAIEEHNQRAAKLAKITEAMGRAPATTLTCFQATPVYLNHLDTSDASDATAYETARYLQLRDAAVEAILNYPDGRGYFATTQMITASTMTPADQKKAMALNIRRSGRILVQSFDAWQGDGLETLRKYDVFFRMRRSKHLASSLMIGVKDKQDPLLVPPAVWTVVNHFYQVYEVVQWAMIGALTDHNFGWQSLSGDYPDLDTATAAAQQQDLVAIAQTYWGQAAACMDALLTGGVAVPVEPTEVARDRFYGQLKLRMNEGTAGAGAEGNLLEAIDVALKAAVEALLTSPDPATARAGALLRDEFCRFLEIDRQLFLLQVGSDFESTDVIHVVRFSPLDAQRGLSRGRVQDKVRGSVLAAFGGFFKKTWRANDIMVGRLDAACLLTECLLTRERLAALGAVPGAVPVSVSVAELSACFSHQTALQIDALAVQINGYLAAPCDQPTEAWEALVDAMVGAAHHEIFLEEYPTVVRCAIEQEADWGRYHVSKGGSGTDVFSASNLAWYRARNKPDQVIVDIAAEAIASGRIPPYLLTPFAPGSKNADTFLDEIPDTVLEQITALAGIRLGKGLVASTPEKWQPAVARSKVFRFVFGGVAPIVYRYARLRRTQPDTVIILNTAIVVACLMAIVMGAVLLLWGHLQLVAIEHVLIVMGVALAVGVLWALLLRR